jgi:hypothetical protein
MPAARSGGIPYAVRFRLSSEAVAIVYDQRQGLWVPAFAGTTNCYSSTNVAVSATLALEVR